MVEFASPMMDAATRLRYLAVAASLGARIAPAEEEILLACADRMGIPRLHAREILFEVGQGGTISLPELGKGAEREAFLSDLIAAAEGEGLPFLQRVAARFGVSPEDVARWAREAGRSARPRNRGGRRLARYGIAGGIALATAGLLLLLYLLTR